MLRYSSHILVTALALALTPVPAGAQSSSERVLKLERSTPVREYAGRLLFSRWNGTAYHLATLHDGQLRDLPVRVQSEPFDADIGPDSRGKPSVVISLCARACDLFVLGLADGDVLRPARNANSTGNDETSPSVWKGRLVFARRYGARVIPYTKLLRAPRAQPSQRLAGLPAKRCGAGEAPFCREIKDAVLVQMELYGDRIAQSWRYQPDNFPGFRQNEIRLTNVARSDTRQLAFMGTGIAGQTYLGPSIVDGRVAFFRACQVDGGGCSTRNSGAIRYRISTRSYQIAGANKSWSGWTWSGGAAFHVPSTFACGEGGSPTDQCGIYRQPRLDWRDVDAGRIR